MDQAPPPTVSDLENVITQLAELISAVDQAHPLTRGVDMGEALFMLRTACPYSPPPESNAVAWSNALRTALIGAS